MQATTSRSGNRAARNIGGLILGACSECGLGCKEGAAGLLRPRPLHGACYTSLPWESQTTDQAPKLSALAGGLPPRALFSSVQCSVSSAARRAATFARLGS